MTTTKQEFRPARPLCTECGWPTLDEDGDCYWCSPIRINTVPLDEHEDDIALGRWRSDSDGLPRYS